MAFRVGRDIEEFAVNRFVDIATIHESVLRQNVATIGNENLQSCLGDPSSVVVQELPAERRNNRTWVMAAGRLSAGWFFRDAMRGHDGRRSTRSPRLQRLATPPFDQ